MTHTLELHADRLFPVDSTVRSIARELYTEVRACPIVSPHGHCDPAWFADDAPFSDPTSLLVAPDHYLTRMLYSQGVPLTSLPVGPVGRATSRSTARPPPTDGDDWPEGPGRLDRRPRRGGRPSPAGPRFTLR